MKKKKSNNDADTMALLLVATASGTGSNGGSCLTSSGTSCQEVSGTIPAGFDFNNYCATVSGTVSENTCEVNGMSNCTTQDISGTTIKTCSSL